jgi:hypothetical protein
LSNALTNKVSSSIEELVLRSHSASAAINLLLSRQGEDLRQATDDASPLP